MTFFAEREVLDFEEATTSTEATASAFFAEPEREVLDFETAATSAEATATTFFA